MATLVLAKTSIATAAANWKQQPFYQKSIVLGVDIGLGGIGLYLRKGTEEIAAASVLLELPSAKPLADRRLKRSARHARNNRRTRMKRLEQLFAKHGLPWQPVDVMRRTDPFKLRHRAVTGRLGSVEALSNCIRSVVMHRGYDYSYLTSDSGAGAYPWGDSASGSVALDWLRTTFVDESQRSDLEKLAPELQWKKGDEEENTPRYLDAIQSAIERSKQQDIKAVLAEHHKGDKRDNLRSRARGHNFPREVLAKHLFEIIDRHRDMVTDVEGFLRVLFMPMHEKGAKEQAIFHYQRKTPDEMRQIWERKRKRCPYFEHLFPEKSSAPPICAKNSDWPVRKWNLLEFLSTRRVILAVEPKKAKGKTAAGPEAAQKSGKTEIRATLPQQVVQLALDLAAADHAGFIAVTPPSAVPRTSFNTLKSEILKWGEAAHPGTKVKLAASTKENDPNHSFFDQLRDLLSPTLAAQRETASLCSESALKLLEEAGANEVSLPDDWDSMPFSDRLKDCGYYLWKRQARLDYGIYPQVEKLLGPVSSLRKNPGSLPGGILGRWFRDHADRLDGKVAPDYCVIEVIGDMPRNKDQKKEMENNMKERRDKRTAEFASQGVADEGKKTSRRRIALYLQQGGICPYTGNPLGSPSNPDCDIDHLFPQSLGGLSMDDNLVLTFKTANGEKDNRTPYTWRGPAGFTALLDHTKSMKWSAGKRELFAWGSQPEHFTAGKLNIPPFGNTTRMGQLSRQLVATVHLWMGIATDTDAQRIRVGTPTGWQTAQARRTWLSGFDRPYLKNRDHFVHHLLDAAILSHLPPAEGMNHVDYGGLFYDERVDLPASADRPARKASHTCVLPGLLERESIAHWLPEDETFTKCPVVAPKSSGKHKTLGDESFWKQIKPDSDRLAQRTPLKLDGKLADPEAILARLNEMRPSDPGKAALWDKNIPDRKTIERWVHETTAASKKEGEDIKATPPVLKLKDGTPIRNLWKFNGKGTLSAVGWTGQANDQGKLAFLRSLINKYARLELWLGYYHHPKDSKKSGWKYQRRLIPDKRCLEGMKRMGLVWSRTDKHHPAPDWMQDKPGEQKTLRELILGKLLPGSVRITSIEKGMVVPLFLDGNGDITVTKTETAWKNYYRVTAINNSGKIEFSNILLSSPAGTKLDGVKKQWLTQEVSEPQKLALILGFEGAADLAASRGIRIPPLPNGFQIPALEKPHDSSPNPTRRRSKRPSCGEGQADLGL